MYDVAIVGGGTAGSCAATFTGRAGLQTVVIDIDRGMTRRAMLNNHHGFPEGVTGPQLVELGQQQAEKAGATWIKGEVTGLDSKDGGFSLTTGDGQSVEARIVLLTLGGDLSIAKAAGLNIAPGTEPRRAEIVAVDAEGKTSLAGVWAAGTCAGASAHTIISAGEGARVAINIISGEKGERWVDHDRLP